MVWCPFVCDCEWWCECGFRLSVHGFSFLGCDCEQWVPLVPILTDCKIRLTGAALLTALYCFIFRSPMHLERGEIVILAVIAAIAGLISMVGDLTASAIKRNYDIKDYGKLIPGHGGILDRFDSMIITAPIIYFLALHML